MANAIVSSGISALDDILQGLRIGDNVVWQVDSHADYLFFLLPFVEESLQNGRQLVYIRFADHQPLITARDGVEIIEVNPAAGFDHFSRIIHQIIEEHGREVFYLFDNLSSLVEKWATDELLANFFQVTCPFLFELDTVAYFALKRGRHSHSAVARIRDTTQVLIDIYHVDERVYLHPLKVWDRFSQSMFLPHLVSGEQWQPLIYSGDAAGLTSIARKHPLRRAVPSIAPWESVFHKLLQHCGVEEAFREVTPELLALQQELIRMLMGDHQEFERLAEEYFTADDLLQIRERLIGSGRIGGKASGMLLARKILRRNSDAVIDFSEILEEHDSFYIGSDVFYTFLVTNDLFRLRLQLSRNFSADNEEFAEVEQRFLAGSFPPVIVEQFRNMLDYYGQAPIIVRSSSLLEDSFDSAFAGKYRSEFCTNQGDLELRLANFLTAIKLVYASALNPNVLAYRKKRGLSENDEQMAVLVQRVSGMPQGRFFFPILAGVAFSRNLYAWSERINAEAGVIRLVYGLGTRAVDRVDSDYPRMIAVSNPSLRPEIGMKVKRYSQRQVDVLDLQENQFVTLPCSEVLGLSQREHLYYLISKIEEGDISDPISNYIATPTSQMVITFNNLIRKTAFVKIIEKMLQLLEKAYGHPVDTEFTAAVDAQGHIRVNLLQCRPLFLPGSTAEVAVVDEIPAERILFRTHGMMNGGEVSAIHYIIYVDPVAYSHHADSQGKQGFGRIIGQLNEHPAIAEDTIMMMGPGRWGSSNIDLGVNVGYADINNTRVLVEIAREEAGHMPEVSYGTHFFLDLVEAQIVFLAVYPDEAESDFNSNFFNNSPNLLTSFLPEAAAFQHLLRVIDVRAASNGRSAYVVANSATRSAVCYLD